MLKASQHHTKRAALSAESTNSTPPLAMGLLATMPTGLPSSRPRPTISSGANSGFSSKKLSASTSESMTSCMSYASFSVSGTRSAVNARTGTSAR